MLILYAILALVAGDDENELASCKRINPCAVSLSTYPLLEDGDFSGYGSGLTPVYDEVLTHEIFDFNADPRLTNFSVCDCGPDRECDVNSADNSIKVDYHITLHFCDKSAVSTVCRRNDINARIIGGAYSTGDLVDTTLVDVSKAMVFCNCANGFTRQSVEPWVSNEISLNYKCL